HICPAVNFRHLHTRHRAEKCRHTCEGIQSLVIELHLASKPGLHPGRSKLGKRVQKVRNALAQSDRADEQDTQGRTSVTLAYRRWRETIRVDAVWYDADLALRHSAPFQSMSADFGACLYAFRNHNILFGADTGQ